MITTCVVTYLHTEKNSRVSYAFKRVNPIVLIRRVETRSDNDLSKIQAAAMRYAVHWSRLAVTTRLR